MSKHGLLGQQQLYCRIRQYVLKASRAVYNNDENGYTYDDHRKLQKYLKEWTYRYPNLQWQFYPYVKKDKQNGKHR